VDHPLHLAIADAISGILAERDELVRDPACGGSQHLPLFVGPRKGSDTRMCCVDLLVIRNARVRAIVEVEESGFLPTKVCGKFLQSALADHFIHDSRGSAPIPYSDSVLFLQVLDGSACLKTGGRKQAQGGIIEAEIQSLLPLRGLTDYKLHFVNGTADRLELQAVAAEVSSALAQRDPEQR
jgi:hypothetical protein